MVPSALRRTVRRFVKLRPLGGGAWLAQIMGRSPDYPQIEPVDADTWVVQLSGGSARSLQAIGPKELRTHLLVDERASRAQMNRLQRALGGYLALEQIAWALRELSINCVLDVGANTGQYGRRLRAAGYTGRIVSFEPLKHLLAELKECAANDPEWLVFDCALGDKDAKAQINVVPGKMSSLLESSEFAKEWSRKLQNMHPETVHVRRLDTVFDEATALLPEPRVFLKMDTQGYDLRTFRGAGTRLNEIIGLQSEVACVPIYDGMPRLPEQLGVYESEGFEIVGMFPVSRDLPTLRVIEFDMVMVRTAALQHRSA